jgi:chemotaxis protein methyltransferase CheR
MPIELVDTWFTEEMPGRYAVHARLRDMVEFRQLNLVEVSTYPSGFDLILCRNVLMYFTRDVVSRIVQAFRRSLRDDGWLVPSMTEVTLVNAPGLESRRFGEVTLFTRQNRIATLLQFTRQETPAEDTSEVTHEHYHFRNPFASLLHLREDLDTTSTENAIQEEENVPEIAGSRAEEDRHEYAGSRPAAEERGEQEHRLSSEGLLRDALALADSGALEQARILAVRAVELEKMKPEAHFVLATILREMGETTAAAASFDRALYLDHEMIVAHVAAASVQRMLGRADRALRHIATARGLLLRLGGGDAAVPLSDLTAGALLDMLGTLETPHG